MCGIIRRSTAVQTWTTGRLLHSAISSQLRERVVFLSEPEDSLVSLILGNTSKRTIFRWSELIYPNIQITEELF